jgi:hypothetical protein
MKESTEKVKGKLKSDSIGIMEITGNPMVFRLESVMVWNES